MACKYYKYSIHEERVLGQLQPITIEMHLCRLKLNSEMKKIRVYQALFSKGLEGSLISDSCPIALRSKNWEDCPFYESA